MPQVVAAIAEWLGTEVTIAGVTVTYGTLVEVAIVAGSIAYSSMENAKLRNQLAQLTADHGRDTMARDPLANRRLVYGQIRLTGPIVYMATEGAKNENLHVVVALASHEVDSIGEVSFDNDEVIPLDGSGNAIGKYAGFFTFESFTGTDTQAASAQLQAAFPGVWTANHKLSGIAYFHAVVKYNADLYPNGLPTIKCIVRGRKIYDPRDVSQDSAVPSTWKWSSNSALCLADFLHDADWGRGIAWSRIRSDDLSEAANISDEPIGRAGSLTLNCSVLSGVRHINTADVSQIINGVQVSGLGIPSGSRVVSVDGSGIFFTIDKDPTSTHASTNLVFGDSENRYETHGIVTSDQLSDSVIVDLAGAMAGRAVDTGGLWTIRAGAYRTPTVDLGDDQLIGPFTVIPRQSRRDTYNGVKGVYVSPANQWIASDFPAIKNDTYMSWDGGVRLWKDVSYPFTISPSMAQRLAKIDLERGRQQIVIEAVYKLHAFECMPVDTIRITRAELGWTNKEFEVTNWKFTVISGEDGKSVSLAVKITARETAAAVWDWADGSETVVDLAENTNLPSPFDIPAAPASLTLLDEAIYQPDGTVHPAVKLTWPLSGNTYIENGGFTETEYKQSSSPNWITWSSPRGDQTFDRITDVQVGVSYDFRIRYRNQLSVRSPYTTVTGHTVAAAAVVPTAPGAATLTASGTYRAGDGTVLAFLTFTVPALPTGAAKQFLLYKRSADTEWLTASRPLFNVAPLTGVTIMDLTPTVAYAIAIIAMSSLDAPSTITAATSSPFTAPSPSASADPTSFAGHTPSSTWSIAPAFINSVSGGVPAQVPGLTVSFTPSTARDVQYVEFGWDAIGSSNVTPPSNWRVRTPNFQGVQALYPGGFTAYLWARTINTSGVTGTEFYTGIEMGALVATSLTLGNSSTTNVGTSAGTVSAGDDSRITGAAQKSANLSDLASTSTARSNLGVTASGADTAYAFRANNLGDLANTASARSNLGVTATGADTAYAFRANNLSDVANKGTSRKNLGVWLETYVPSALSGGSPTENVNIDITAAGCASAVAVALVSCVSDSGLWAVHDYSSGSNSSTNLVVTVGTRDGTNISGGLRRFSVMLLIP